MSQNLEGILALMRNAGAGRIYAKTLSANDNSKNQIYLGSAFNLLPVGSNAEPVAGKDGTHYRIELDFNWMDSTGTPDPAPGAQLILYPQYPEVRLSGFLQGCPSSPSELMNVREEGRVLLLGITGDGKRLAYAAGRQSRLAREYAALDVLEEAGVLKLIPASAWYSGKSPEEILLERLKEIYGDGDTWHSGRILGAGGVERPYSAPNAGGYTLEALFGITANSSGAPDFGSYELKAHGNSPLTLMTPEPDGGLYNDQGVEQFLYRYGYPAGGTADKLNFSSPHYTDIVNSKTGLRLQLEGYDSKTYDKEPHGRIIGEGAGLNLQVPSTDERAAFWSFSKILRLWSTKHRRTAFVGYRRRPSANGVEFSFGPEIYLCESRNPMKLVRALHEGAVYYDPGIKIENLSNKPQIKCRNQFRMRWSNVCAVYDRVNVADLSAQEAPK